MFANHVQTNKKLDTISALAKSGIANPLQYFLIFRVGEEKVICHANIAAAQSDYSDTDDYTPAMRKDKCRV